MSHKPDAYPARDRHSSGILNAPNVVRYMILFALLGILQASLGPMIRVVAVEHGISAATAGWLLSAFFVGSLCGTLFCAVAGERRIGHLSVAPLTGMVAAGALGLVFLPSWPTQLGAVAVTGFGFGALTLMINTEMAGRTENGGLARVNLINAAFALGAAAGPTVVAMTLQGSSPWGLVVVAIVVLATVRRHTDTCAARSESETRSQQPVVVVPRQLHLFCLLLFLYPALETGLSSWETTYLSAVGYEDSSASMLNSLFWVGLAAGRFAVPAVAARWSPARSIQVALAMSLGSLVLIGVPALAPIGFLIAGVCIGPINPSALAWIAQVTVRPRRTSALAVASAMFGNAALPTALGYAMAATSERTLPVFVAVAVVGDLAITLGLIRVHSRTSSFQEQ
ncbi:MFS transporter [Nocardia sp. NPDC051052]|uniref:MFS transporter n=1 Tax=Nocardia sp. NPDC051052 TaxID=3364322 RepID=UPI0037AD68FA